MVPLVLIQRKKMRINKKQIAHALGIDSDDLSSKDMAIALMNIESILDKVADNLDDDFESAALGDASNLVQVIREGL
jgi:DNA-directed RNA polymerase specialized sigma subunit